MFKGIATLSLDAKGRLTMPTKHRDKIMSAYDGKLVVTIDQANCLNIYPLPIWEEIEKQLSASESNDEAVTAFRRLYVGHATEVEMDAQGRISIPQPLRDRIGLDKKVALVGQLHKFELWDEQAWDENTTKTINDKKEGRLKLPSDVKVIF